MKLGKGKLRLHKESLRVLSGAALAQVHGGGSKACGGVIVVDSANPDAPCEGVVKGDKSGLMSIEPALCTFAMFS